MSATFTPSDSSLDLPQALDQARQARDSGLWSDAERLYRVALALAPSQSVAWEELAFVLQAQGAVEQADAAKAKAAEADVATAAKTAMSLLGTPLEDRAPAILRKASERHPSIVDGHLALAESLRRIGDLMGASKAAERCLELRPGHDRAASLAFSLTGGARSSDGGDLLPAPVLVLDDFLPAELHEEILRLALAHRSALEPSTTLRRTQEDWRRSRVDRHPAFGEALLALVCDVAQMAIARFGLQPFDIVSRDMQFTVHNDGDFYKPHRDAREGDLGHRRLTYVYYLNREPRGFEGGGLRLFDTSRGGNRYAEQAFTKVMPQSNRLVLFPSYVWHEVEAISCRSGLYEDSRFTLNGWLGVAPK
jgi:hypothetical protein